MRILLCPLDWGLGHAARCIPLIRALRENGHEVRVGAAGGGKLLLEREFPGLDIFDFPGTRIRYARNPALFLPVMLMQLPGLFLGMLSEKRRLRRILDEQQFDLIISDGRYGVCTSRIAGIFITHQVFIRIPGRFPGLHLAERLLLALNLRLLRRFRRVWVPDFPGDKNLSGDLSHGSCLPGNLEFIGPLSRLARSASDEGGEPLRIDVLALVSGPEPQRGMFEEALDKEMRSMTGTRVLVRGQPGREPSESGSGGIRPGEMNAFAHLAGEELARLIVSADLVVARSGYTTVMELAGLGARAAILVPTPGQSEQEYLADHLQASGAAIRMDQSHLDLRGAREKLEGLAGFSSWNRKEEMPDGNAFSLAVFLARHDLLANRDPGP